MVAAVYQFYAINQAPLLQELHAPSHPHRKLNVII